MGGSRSSTMRWPGWATTVLLLGFLAAQMAFAWQTREIDPIYRDLGPAPSDAQLAAQTMGDPQFLFRSRSLQLQHTGFLDGRVLGYRDLDYDRLADWFTALDKLDRRADAVPTMAAFLYRDEGSPEEMRELVGYLAEHARAEPARKWRWMTHAVHLSRYYVRDLDLALSLAQEVALWHSRDGVPMPNWARQLPVFVLQARGEKEAARILLLSMLENPDLPPSERRWIEFYINRYLTSDPETAQ